MRISSVNTGRPREIVSGAKRETTGIYKEPVESPVPVSRDGLRGDAVMDRKHHGGPDQAVYLYGGEDYAWWERELGRRLEPGTFGENLTVAGLASPDLAIGDRLRVGEVLLQVTAARIPCGTLARRMEDSHFVKRFRAAGRPGAYCRVLEEGEVRAGDEAVLLPYEGDRISLAEMMEDWYVGGKDAATVRRYLATPLAERARREQEERLSRLLAGSADAAT